MRKLAVLAALFASVALGQNAPNVLQPGTPSRPVWVTGTVNLNPVDGGVFNVTVTSTTPQAQDGGALYNGVGVNLLGNNNGTAIAISVNDAGFINVSNTPVGIPQIYFDGGTVTCNAGTGAWALHQVYFDGGAVQATIVGIPQVYFDGGTVTISNASLAVTQSGSWTGVTTQGINATNAGVSNPVMVATRAVNDSVAPTAVNVTNQGSAIGDLYGRPMVQTWHPNHWSCNINSDAGISLCETAPGAGLSLYVTDVNFSALNQSLVALTSGASNVCDGGTVTTVLGVVSFNLNQVVPWSTNLQTPLKVPANTALCCSATTATTCNVSGFIAP